jgi:type IV secretion system protein VirD4
VLFLLDEFGHLGRMRPIEEAVALVPGYGLSFWFFLQDLSQLKSVYHEHWPTFLANCEVLQAFGTNDVDTAEYLSRRLGEATIQVESETRSAGRSEGKTGSRSQSAGHGVSERARRLLTPDEVLRLPPDRQLLMVKGRDPVLAGRLSYFGDPEFRDRAGRPVYAASSMHTNVSGTAATVPPARVPDGGIAAPGGAARPLAV